MATLNSIEGMTDRAARIAAYREFLREQSSHSLAWFNLAVDELDGGDRIAARRAALTALAIDDALRARLPARLRGHLEFGGYRLRREIHASPSQLLYVAARADGGEVYLRSLRDRPHALAVAAYQAHQAVPVAAIELIAALGTVEVAGGETFQILEYQPGRPVGQLLRGDGPERGFGVEVVPRIDGEIAAAVALEVLEQLAASRHDLNPDPDLWLRTRRGVISLGPPGWSPTVEWMAPEERDPGAAQGQVAVYRAALMVWVALTSRSTPGLDLSDRRTLPVEALPERYQPVGPTLAAAVAHRPDARPTLAKLIERLRAVTTSSVSGAHPGRPTVPGYKIVRPLGEGGFGTVWEALTPDGRRVAIKVLHPHLATSAEARDRFFAEAEIAARVEHPGVIRALGRGTHDGLHYVVMEMVDGESLDRRIARSPLTPAETAQVGREVAAATGAMHAATPPVIHRDLKPANIMLAPRDDGADAAAWTARVCDFGVAKLLDEPDLEGTPFTRTGQWNGSPPYMAPEQWRQESVDARTDVYALGCVLYEALAGAPPFAGKAYALLDAHLHKPPPPLPATVPPALAAAILRMLAKEPDERFATMAEVEAALADPALLRPAETPVPTPPVPTPPVPRDAEAAGDRDTPPTPPRPDRPDSDSDEPSANRRPIARYAALGAIAAVIAGVVIWRVVDGSRAHGGGSGGSGSGTGSDQPPPPPPPPSDVRLAATEGLRAELRVLGWSHDSGSFKVEIAYRRAPGEPTPWRVIAEYDALREDSVTRWWDQSAAGYAVDAEPGWGPEAEGDPVEALDPARTIERQRLVVELCDPPSSRKVPTSIEPADTFLVRWGATGALTPSTCLREEDKGLVVVRDREQPWSRLLRYAYKPGRLPGKGQLTFVPSPDGRRVAIAVVDRSDDGDERSVRVFNRALGAQVHVVAGDARTARAALMKLERVGIAATYELRTVTERRMLMPSADAGPTAQEADLALHLNRFVIEPTADPSLKWRDLVIELGPP